MKTCSSHQVCPSRGEATEESSSPAPLERPGGEGREGGAGAGECQRRRGERAFCWSCLESSPSLPKVETFKRLHRSTIRHHIALKLLKFLPGEYMSTLSLAKVECQGVEFQEFAKLGFFAPISEFLNNLLLQFTILSKVCFLAVNLANF